MTTTFMWPTDRDIWRREIFLLQSHKDIKIISREKEEGHDKGKTMDIGPKSPEVTLELALLILGILCVLGV